MAQLSSGHPSLVSSWACVQTQRTCSTCLSPPHPLFTFVLWAGPFPEGLSTGSCSPCLPQGCHGPTLSLLLRPTLTCHPQALGIVSRLSCPGDPCMVRTSAFLGGIREAVSGSVCKLLFVCTLALRTSAPLSPCLPHPSPTICRRLSAPQAVLMPTSPLSTVSVLQACPGWSSAICLHD